MSLLQRLKADLTGLSVESRRKYTTIKKASTKSLDILKSFPIHSFNDETEAVNSLRNYSDFVDPFLISCHSKNPKFILTSLGALSQLIQFHAIPYTKLDELISALQEATHSSTDIQLRVLQILPTLFASYRMDINDESLSNLLYVCTLLQSSTKVPAIVSTAQATFSQMMNIVFEKVNEEDKQLASGQVTDPARYTVPSDESKTIKVHLCAYDAQRVFSDLCTLIEHHKPTFLKTNYMTEDDGFEILESIIKNNQSVFLTHVELGHLLRIRVAPILLRFISSCNEFSLMVRVSRLVYLLISNMLDVTNIESEVALSLLTHLLSEESKTPRWKKIFCLEIYCSLFKDFSNVERIFNEYDNNDKEEWRSIILDFVKAAGEIVRNSSKALNATDVIQPPPSQSDATVTQPGASQSKGRVSTSSLPEELRVFSISKASIKQSYMDSINKSDPPDVPVTYPLSLIAQTVISLSEGICGRSLELASRHSQAAGVQAISFLNENSFEGGSEQDQKEYKCVFALTQNCWKEILQIFEIFLHSTVDDETFAYMVRSLQRLGHAAGVLSVADARVEIIQFFSISTIQLVGKVRGPDKSLSFSESIAGTISSAFGQAVSNISHGGGSRSGDEPAQPSAVPIYPRDMHSRHTMCFRALTNLAISLGEVLGSSWTSILIVLQWVSYYVDGPSGFSVKDIPAISPYLSNDDLSVISNSLDKFMAALGNQSPKVFLEVCRSLVGLSDSILTVSINSPGDFGRRPVSEEGEKLIPCIYNRQFYLNKLSDVCTVAPLKFLVLRSDCWDCVKAFYIRLSVNRELDDETRTMLARNFDSVVRATSVAGFDESVGMTDDERRKVYLETEHKVLNGLNDYLQQLSGLPATDQVLVLNVEMQMALQMLKTLKTIIDRFGNKIRQEWVLVMKILDLPFDIIGKHTEEKSEDNTTKEMVVSLLRSSFESLKVILDEALQNIPLTQVQLIIDTLFNFVAQKYDLNISFNSSSYFWLISDYLKEKLDALPQKELSSEVAAKVVSEDQLMGVVKSDPPQISPDSSDYCRCLWLYLIHMLARTTDDSRAQVRNGSLITFFNVVEAFADENPPWLLLHKIVLEPIILKIKPDSTVYSASRAVQKEWIDTLSNVSHGLTKLFTRHLSVFSAGPKALSDQKQFWGSYIDYLLDLVNLDQTWIALHTSVFKDFKTVLTVFAKVDGLAAPPPDVPDDIVEAFYRFWVSVKIVYSLTDDSFYEDSLCSFASSFDLLLPLMKPILTVPKFERMLMQLNTCIRFPVLIASRKDDKRCTNIQKQVLDNLEQLSFADPAYRTTLVQQLCSVVTLPFSTKDLIEEKLGGKGVRIPSFKAASLRALGLLEVQLQQVDDPSIYLQNRSISKTFMFLLEPCKLKADPKTQMESGDHLWMKAVHCVCLLSEKVAVCMGSDQCDDKTKVDVQQHIWPKLIEVFKSCFVSSDFSGEAGEKFDLDAYNRLKQVLTSLVRSLPQDSYNANACSFIKIVWRSSFLYELDAVEKELVFASDSPAELLDFISSHKVATTFGTTLPVTPVKRINIARTCLQDLISFSISDDEQLSAVALDFFATRCLFAVDKFISDESLLNRKPVPCIQQSEMRTIVSSGLLPIFAALKSCSLERKKLSYKKLLVLYPTLVELVQSSHKVLGLSQSVTSVYQEFGSVNRFLLASS